MVKKKTTKKNETLDEKSSALSFLKTRETQTIIGSFLILFSFFLLIAFISFFFNWQEDQSTLTELTNKAVTSKNLLGKLGAKLSHFFIYNGFGIGAFGFPVLLFISGLYCLFKSQFSKLITTWNWGLVMVLWVAISFGFVQKKYALLSGVIGYEINNYASAFLGKTGLAIVLLFFLLAYIIVRFKITPEKIIRQFKRTKQEIEKPLAEEIKQVGVVVEKEKKEVVSKNETVQKSEFELSVENYNLQLQIIQRL